MENNGNFKSTSLHVPCCLPFTMSFTVQITTEMVKITAKIRTGPGPDIGMGDKWVCSPPGAIIMNAS